MAETKLYHAGAWRTITEIKVKHAGAWRLIDTLNIKHGGSWREVYSGCSHPTSASWTLAIGSDTHIYTYSTWTWSWWQGGYTFDVSNDAKGLDAGIDYYSHTPSFGSLNGTGGVYDDYNCVERIITSSYFVDTYFGARTTYIVIDTPGSTTPDNDDVFREFTQGTETLDRTTGGTFRSTGVLNTSARYWRFLGTDSPHGTSGNTTLTLRFGP